MPFAPGSRTPERGLGKKNLKANFSHCPMHATASMCMGCATLADIWLACENTKIEYISSLFEVSSRLKK
jgi:hypothetical protein